MAPFSDPDDFFADFQREMKPVKRIMVFGVLLYIGALLAVFAGIALIVKLLFF